MTRRGVVLVGLAAVLVGCSDADGSEPDRQQSAENRVEQRTDRAYEFCVEKITEQLRAPATAQFSERGPNREASDGDTYFFTGTVDSENGFGALLRSEFGCEIRWTPTGFLAEKALVE